MRIAQHFVFLILFLASPLGFGAEKDDGKSRGYTFAFGLSTKEVSLDVYDEDAANPNGTLTEGMYTTVFFSLDSPYTYFAEKSRFGYYLEYGLSVFKMTEQLVGLEEVNLGTSARGYYLYVTPTIFYLFGDKAFNDGKGSSFKFGLGVGAGYLRAKGDIIFTEQSQERHAFNVGGLGLSVSLFMDYRINSWLFRVRSVGPFITESGRDYSLSAISMDMGYLVAF